MERPDARAEKAQADGAGEFGNSISLFLYCCAGISPLRRRRGGFPIAPSTPSAPPLLGLSAASLFLLHGESPLRRRPKGNENRRSLRSLFGNVWRRYFWGLFTALFFVARGETSPIRSLYITNIIPKACVSGKQSTVLRKDEHSSLFNQICYDFSAKRRKILLKNR